MVISAKDVSSVPFFESSRPNAVLREGGRNIRLDGRAFDEFREFVLTTGVVSQAAGSAYLELGSTKVMTAVYGPRQSDRKYISINQGTIQVDVKYATFSTRQRGRIGQSPKEKDMSDQVSTALLSAVILETFPKAVLDVQCTILEAGGGELGATIVAAAAAIASAGVDMKNVVSACTITSVDCEVLLLDPSSNEEYHEQNGLVVATLGSNEVAHVLSWGQWRSEKLKEGIELALGGCAQIEEVVRNVLKEKMSECQRDGGLSYSTL